VGLVCDAGAVTSVIHTERLVLREWRETDKQPYALLNADPEVMRHFPSQLSREQSDEMVDRMAAAWEQRGFGLWAAERVDTHQFIGFIGLSMPGWHVDGLTPCVEVGWRIDSQHWGHGFAPEGARAALEYAFEHVELPERRGGQLHHHAEPQVAASHAEDRHGAGPDGRVRPPDDTRLARTAARRLSH
jgi:RimJ/RimL family protein N-acetyltransferase